MIESLSAWMRQIGSLLIIAGLAEMILPRSGERQAVRFLIGLIVIFALVEPVGTWIGRGTRELAWQLDPMFSSGRDYIERGQQFAEDAMTSLLHTDKQRLERGLAAIISLVDGLDSASVTLHGDGSDNNFSIVVTLRIHDAVARGTDLWVEQDPEESIERRRTLIEHRVADLIEGLYPELTDVDFVWEDTTFGATTSFHR